MSRQAFTMSADRFRRIVRAVAPWADGEQTGGWRCVEFRCPPTRDRLTATATNGGSAARYAEYVAHAEPFSMYVDAQSLLAWVRNWPTLGKKIVGEHSVIVDPSTYSFVLDGPTGRVSTAFPETPSPDQMTLVPDEVFRATGDWGAGRYSAFLVDTDRLGRIETSFDTLAGSTPVVLTIDVGHVASVQSPTIIVSALGQQLPPSTDLRVALAARRPPTKRGE